MWATEPKLSEYMQYKDTIEAQIEHSQYEYPRKNCGASLMYVSAYCMKQCSLNLFRLC